MPVYDFKCPDGCGYYSDIYVPLSEHGTTTCPDCNKVMETVIGPVVTIGPMPSKPLVVKQVGRSFESDREWKAYQRDNPDCAIVSADSNAWREHRDTAYAKAEATARKQGYNDLEHKHTTRKKEKAKKAGRLDKNIYVH